mgnify:CR=1 FL=1
MDDEPQHSMMPSAAASVSSTAIPSNQFVQTYIARLEDKERLSKGSMYLGHDVEIGGTKTKGQVLKDALDFSMWSRWKVFVSTTFRQHPALAWVNPEAGTRRVVRAFAFSIYMFTHIFFMLWLLPPSPCSQKPQEVKCDLPMMEGADVQELAVYRQQAQMCEMRKDLYTSQLKNWEKCQAEEYIVYTRGFMMSWMDLVVAILTEIAASLVMGIYEAAFEKSTVYGHRTEWEKVRIIQFWKIKELFGILFGAVWSAFCVFYIFMRVVNAGDQGAIEQSSAMSFCLGEEIVKPFIPILILWSLLHFGRKLAMGRFVLTLKKNLNEIFG